jgi:hypothetical protein
MAEYIDREEVLKHKAMLYDPLNTRSWFFVVTTQSIMRIPSADVAPVVRGRWLTWDEKFPGRATGKNLGVFCSVCGNHSDYSSDFCPNCGAKMEEKS